MNRLRWLLSELSARSRHGARRCSGEYRVLGLPLRADTRVNDGYQHQQHCATGHRTNQNWHVDVGARGGTLMRPVRKAFARSYPTPTLPVFKLAAGYLAARSFGLLTTKELVFLDNDLAQIFPAARLRRVHESWARSRGEPSTTAADDVNIVPTFHGLAGGAAPCLCCALFVQPVAKRSGGPRPELALVSAEVVAASRSHRKHQCEQCDKLDQRTRRM